MENLLNIKNLIFYLVLYSFVFSCNQSVELKEISITKEYQSSEPNLYTSINGDTYLSFISTSCSFLCFQFTMVVIKEIMKQDVNVCLKRSQNLFKENLTLAIVT